MVLKRMCGEEESRGKPADPGSPGRMAFKPVCGHSVASRYCNLIIYLYNLPADNSFVFFWFPTISVDLKESPCPREPIYKSLSSDLKSLSLSLDHKVLENCQWLYILQTVHYVWSCDVHKFSYRRLWFFVRIGPIRFLAGCRKRRLNQG